MLKPLHATCQTTVHDFQAFQADWTLTEVALHNLVNPYPTCKVSHDGGDS